MSRPATAAPVASTPVAGGRPDAAARGAQSQGPGVRPGTTGASRRGSRSKSGRRGSRAGKPQHKYRVVREELDLGKWLTLPAQDVGFFDSDSDHADSADEEDAEIAFRAQVEADKHRVNSEIPEPHLAPLKFTNFGTPLYGAHRPWRPHPLARDPGGVVAAQSAAFGVPPPPPRLSSGEESDSEDSLGSDLDTKRPIRGRPHSRAGSRADSRSRSRAASRSGSRPGSRSGSRPGSRPGSGSPARRKKPWDSTKSRPKTPDELIVPPSPLAKANLKALNRIPLLEFPARAEDGLTAAAGASPAENRSPHERKLIRRRKPAGRDGWVWPDRSKRQTGNCEECDSKFVVVYCKECDMYFCTDCYPEVHKQALSFHTPSQITAGGAEQQSSSSTGAESSGPAESHAASKAPSTSAEGGPAGAAAAALGGLSRQKSTRRHRSKARWGLMRKAAAQEAEQVRVMAAQEKEAKRKRLKAYAGRDARDKYFEVYRNLVGISRAPPGVETDEGQFVKDSPRHRSVNALVRAGVPPEPTLIRRDKQTSLNLAFYGLGPDRVASLVGGIAKLPDVDTVDLRDNRLTDQASASVVNAVVKNGKVEKMDLSLNEVGPLTCAAMESLLRLPHSPLTELTLHDCALGDKAMAALSEGLRARNCFLVHLDLSNNCIGSDGGKALGVALVTNPRLQSLNLEWNLLRGEGAQAMAEALADNRGLTRLNLAWNGFQNEGCNGISHALRKNTALQRLDLSHNGITEQDAIVLGSGIRYSKGLRELRLDSNPVRKGGARALTRGVQARVVPLGLDVWLDGCDLTPSSFKAFDPDNPSGKYEMRLSDAYDHAILQEILYLAKHQPESVRFKEMTLAMPTTVTVAASRGGGDDDDRPAVTTRAGPLGPAEPVSASKREAWMPPEHPPKEGVLKFTLQYIRRSMARTHELKDNVVDNLMNKMVVRQLKPKFSLFDIAKMSLAKAARDRRKEQAFEKEPAEPVQDSKRLQVLKMAAEDLYFDRAAAQKLFDTFESGIAKVTAMAHIVCRMSDVEEVPAFIRRNLNAEQRAGLGRTLGPLYYFNADNPTGHYVLDLSRPFERSLALRLQELNNDDCANNQYEGRADTSEHGNYMSWRNVTLDGEPVQIHDAWVMPSEGKLELDYVSTRRPYARSNIMRPNEFLKYLEQVGFTWKLPRLAALHALRNLDTCYDESIYDPASDEDFPPPRAAARSRGGSTDGLSRPGSAGAASIGMMRRVESERANSIKSGDSGGGARGGADGDDGGDAASDASSEIKAAEADGHDVPDSVHSLTPTQHQMEKIIHNLRTTIGHEQLVFSALQVAMMIKSLPRCNVEIGEEDRRVYMARVEVVVATFAKVKNLDRHKPMVQDLLTAAEKDVMVRRLGWLNVWNSWFPDQFYKLKLDKKEDWIICSALVKLAVDEPGENWVDETYNDFPFELPMSWVEEVPHSGVLTTTYYSGPQSEWAVPETRDELAQKLLISYPLRKGEPRRNSLDMDPDAFRQGILAEGGALGGSASGAGNVKAGEGPPETVREEVSTDLLSATTAPSGDASQSAAGPSATLVTESLVTEGSGTDGDGGGVGPEPSRDLVNGPQASVTEEGVDGGASLDRPSVASAGATGISPGLSMTEALPGLQALAVEEDEQ